MTTTNPNEKIYAPMAAASATKYGVPPSIFKSLINSESSFDPYAYNASGASGIAQFMPSTAKGMNIDPFNPMQALDASAQYLSSNYKKYGNWQDAIAQYKGYSDLSKGHDVANSVLDDAVKKFGGSLDEANPEKYMDGGMFSDADIKSVSDAAAKSASGKTTPSGAIWQWTATDWKNFLANSAFGMLFGFIGVLLIAGSVWVLINKNDAVKKAASLIPLGA